MSRPTNPGFNPEATMSGFAARTGRDIPPPPPRTTADAPSPATSRRGRPTKNTSPERPAPPFGIRRGNRIAYTINLPTPLARALEAAVTASTEPTSYGAIAVDAIRSHWRVFQSPTADDLFPHRRVTAGQLDRAAPRVRKVLYITPDEADAIEAVRRNLGGIELGRPHRLALSEQLISDSS